MGDLGLFLSSKIDRARSINLILRDIRFLESRLPSLNLRAKIDQMSMRMIQTQMLQLQRAMPEMRTVGTMPEVSRESATNARAAADAMQTQSQHAQTAKGHIQRKNIAIQNTNRHLLAQTHQWNKMAKEMGFLDQFAVAMKRIPVWMAGMTAFYAPLRSLREGIADIREIDQQLTELAKVTDASRYELERMRETALDMGFQLGMTSDKVVEATVAFARLGESIEDASRLAEESIIFSTVGNMEVERATTALISAIRAYDLELDGHENTVRSAIDSINETGNNFAISQRDIAEILERSSAAMMEANNTLEETIALGTGAQEISQNARRVGTALKF